MGMQFGADLPNSTCICIRFSDTSFMYVIGMLGMLQIYQLRHPDINANAHVAFALMAFFILIAMCGVVSR